MEGWFAGAAVWGECQSPGRRRRDRRCGTVLAGLVRYRFGDNAEPDGGVGQCPQRPWTVQVQGRRRRRAVVRRRRRVMAEPVFLLRRPMRATLEQRTVSPGRVSNPLSQLALRALCRGVCPSRTDGRGRRAWPRTIVQPSLSGVPHQAGAYPRLLRAVRWPPYSNAGQILMNPDSTGGWWFGQPGTNQRVPKERRVDGQGRVSTAERR